MFVSRRRLGLLVTPQRWFERLIATPGMRLADMSPDQKGYSCLRWSFPEPQRLREFRCNKLSMERQ